MQDTKPFDITKLQLAQLYCKLVNELTNHQLLSDDDYKRNQTSSDDIIYNETFEQSLNDVIFGSNLWIKETRDQFGFPTKTFYYLKVESSKLKNRFKNITFNSRTLTNNESNKEDVIRDLSQRARFGKLLETPTVTLSKNEILNRLKEFALNNHSGNGRRLTSGGVYAAWQSILETGVWLTYHYEGYYYYFAEDYKIEKNTFTDEKGKTKVKESINYSIELIEQHNWGSEPKHYMICFKNKPQLVITD